MTFSTQYIPYDTTGRFSKLMLDYIKGDEKLESFYNYPVSIEGLKNSIAARQQIKTPRHILVAELKKQYASIHLTDKQRENIELLNNEETFTVCTAHQPVIFTGPLYFIYKIIHAIKLADIAGKELPGYKFVPVFYMGSEDADLDELGNLTVNGERLTWSTNQTGAVGRMKVDKALLSLIDRIAGEIEVQPYGRELIQVFRNTYKEGMLLQDATLLLVNELFKDFGLLVVIPDNAVLKKEFEPIVKKELIEGFSHTLVEETCAELSNHYKSQATGRDINLFYLTDNSRERIEKEGDKYLVRSLERAFTQEEILTELEQYPERFSYNVILRPVFQETILSNVVFLGGGGEVAYWLELKRVFEAAGVPYPMLLIRNSFLIINPKQKETIRKLQFKISHVFLPPNHQKQLVVEIESDKKVNLDDEITEMEALFERLKDIAGQVDSTLVEHTLNLKKKAVKKFTELEKKIVRAEIKKFTVQNQQIDKLYQQLFPGNGL